MNYTLEVWQLAPEKEPFLEERIHLPIIQGRAVKLRGCTAGFENYWTHSKNLGTLIPLACLFWGPKNITAVQYSGSEGRMADS